MQLVVGTFTVPRLKVFIENETERLFLQEMNKQQEGPENAVTEHNENPNEETNAAENIEADIESAAAHPANEIGTIK